MKILVSCCCLLFISVSSFAQPFDPLNKNASPEAKRLLKYLYSINGRQLLSGQHNYNESMHRGIIEPTLRQYTILGDAANITDNRIYDGSGPADDRWVFTEDNPGRALEVAAALAAAHRVMKGYNDTLADDCLRIARQLWGNTGAQDVGRRIELAAELYLTTKDKQYADFLVGHGDKIARGKRAP
jgi:hypothetical protein